MRRNRPVAPASRQRPGQRGRIRIGNRAVPCGVKPYANGKRTRAGARAADLPHRPRNAQGGPVIAIMRPHLHRRQDQVEKILQGSGS